MAKQRDRRRAPAAEPTPFEQARDEMFQHIMRSGVIGADPAHQDEWFADTARYLAERYHELEPSEIAELRTLGERFAQPPRADVDAKESSDAASAA